MTVDEFEILVDVLVGHKFLEEVSGLIIVSTNISCSYLKFKNVQRSIL